MPRGPDLKPRRKRDESRPRRRRDPSVRAWAKVDRQGPDECWPWVGKRTGLGYGRFWSGEKEVFAHRFISGVVDGPLGEAVVVRHSCDNPPCCNPAHLLRGSQADNIRDMDERGRRVLAPRPGESNPNARLTAAEVREIRAKRDGGQTLRMIGQQYGVTPQCIRRICLGQTWSSDPVTAYLGTPVDDGDPDW
jgi:hypothetical protein